MFVILVFFATWLISTFTYNIQNPQLNVQKHTPPFRYSHPSTQHPKTKNLIITLRSDALNKRDNQLLNGCYNNDSR